MIEGDKWDIVVYNIYIYIYTCYNGHVGIPLLDYNLYIYICIIIVLMGMIIKSHQDNVFFENDEWDIQQSYGCIPNSPMEYSELSDLGKSHPLGMLKSWRSRT